MNTVLTFVTDHWAAVSFSLAYIIVAGIGTMPAPGDPRPVSQKMYQWMFDTLHLLANKAVERKPTLAVPISPPKP